MIGSSMNESLVILICLALVIISFLALRNVETYDDPITKRIQEDLVKVDPRAEKISIKGSDQSFTEDKTRMYLCLYDEKGKYYDYNMLMYVALHELAHVISKQVDPEHKTKEFRDNFDFLLKRAAAKGLYNPDEPINYGYCPKNSKEIKEHNSGASGATPHIGSSIEPTKA